jgi:hypothetical protein
VAFLSHLVKRSPPFSAQSIAQKKVVIVGLRSLRGAGHPARDSSLVDLWDSSLT